jgi:GTP-binding protein Era
MREKRRSGTVALLGRPNVGKSTMLNALLGERNAITSSRPQTTRDRIAGILTTGDVQFVFLDTPGIHEARHRLGRRMNDLAHEAATSCDVAVVMTDVGDAPKPRVSPEDRAIIDAVPAKTSCVLVINKIDRVKQKDLLFPVLEAFTAARDFAAVIPTSALRKDGTERVLAEVGKLLPEGEPLYGADEMSDKPVRFFVGEFVREQILRKTRQEVPHGVAVTVEAFDEGKKLVRIAVTVHVAKDSHKGIIIGNKGEMLGAIGKAARERAEELLGKKVHLETFVKCTPDWFDDAKRLEDFGYGGKA